MTSETNSCYAVVYQMGKVASSSLVHTLNAIEGFTAVQSHFLGRESFRELVSYLPNATLPEYFFEHQLGQLVSNLRTTRQMNLLRANPALGTLLVISVTRDPFEWIRSVIVQDIEGFLPYFRRLGSAPGTEAIDDDTAVGIAIQKVLKSTNEIVERHGGFDALISRLRASKLSEFVADSALSDPDYFQIFNVIITPLDWFQRHFEVALGLKVAELNSQDGMLQKTVGNASYFILRYERIDEDFKLTLKKMGVRDIPAIAQENLSAAKPFAKAIKAAFESPEAKLLQKSLSETTYSRAFGYDLERSS